MIVSPLTRSVGLNAATASSGVATLPMLVPSRPSRPRCTTSPSWVRLGSTTKSIARPLREPGLLRTGDSHQCSSGSHHTHGPLPEVSAEDIEDQIDPADVLEGVLTRSTNSCAPKSSAACRPPGAG